MGRPLSLAGRWSLRLSSRWALAPMTGAVSLLGVRHTVQGQGPRERWAHRRGCGNSRRCQLRTQTESRRNGTETAVQRLEPRKALERPGGDRERNRRRLLLQRCPGPRGEGGPEPWEVPTKLRVQVTERSTRRAFRARAQLHAECEREGATAKWRGPHMEEEARPKGEKRNGRSVPPMTESQGHSGGGASDAESPRTLRRVLLHLAGGSHCSLVCELSGGRRLVGSADRAMRERGHVTCLFQKRGSRRGQRRTRVRHCFCPC